MLAERVMLRKAGQKVVKMPVRGRECAWLEPVKRRAGSGFSAGRPLMALPMPTWSFLFQVGVVEH